MYSIQIRRIAISRDLDLATLQVARILTNVVSLRSIEDCDFSNQFLFPLDSVWEIGIQCTYELKNHRLSKITFYFSLSLEQKTWLFMSVCLSHVIRSIRITESTELLGLNSTLRCSNQVLKYTSKAFRKCETIRRKIYKCF